VRKIYAALSAAGALALIGAVTPAASAAAAHPAAGWYGNQMCAAISGDNDCTWVSPNGNHFLEAVAYNGGLSITEWSSVGAEIQQNGTNNCITFNGDGNDYIMTTCSGRVSQKWTYLYGSGPSAFAIENSYDHQCMKYDGRNVAPTPIGCNANNQDLYWDTVNR
jgi:hypothetical protein